MRKSLLVVLLLFLCVATFSQSTKNKKQLIKGMYIQWGYNTEWYSKSDIHFTLGDGSKFTIYDAQGTDKPDYDAIIKKPIEISIPQYNYRIGFYLNDQKNKCIELNFDHAKYVVEDFQTRRVTGVIDGVQVDGDSTLNPETFLHMEHTDGANWLHINYVQQKTLFAKKNTRQPRINLIYKMGAGINIPRTDFTYRGDRLNNYFHVAGYNASVEGGVRYYLGKRFFIETTAKTGFVHYLNALANTTQMKGGRIRHHFGYFELIGLFGYDITF